MFDRLNRFGLPVKYAILCCLGGFIGVFLANVFGYNQGGLGYIVTPIFSGLGGAIGGWLRQRKGKVS